MVEDALDGVGLCDEADDAHLAGALGADEGIDLVDAAEEVRPSLSCCRNAGGRGWLRDPVLDGHGGQLGAALGGTRGAQLPLLARAIPSSR